MLHFLDYFLGISAIIGAVIMIILGIIWINFHREKAKASKIKKCFFIVLALVVIVFAADMFIENKINKNIEYHNLNAPVKIIPDSDIDSYDGNKFYTDKNGIAKMNFEVGKHNRLELDDKYSKVDSKGNSKYIITAKLPNKVKEHKITIFAFNNKNKGKHIVVNLVNENKHQQKVQEKADKEVSSGAKKQDNNSNNSEYPEFSSQYPDDLGEYTSEQLTNKQVRFTGKIYGLSADSMGDYMVMLKNDAGQLMYISYDHKDSGKVVLNQKLTVYGATNGLSHVRNQDVDNLGVPSGDLGKPMLLMSADKVTKE
ncbi:hypothetical protein [Apilactobacillus xinyiensis]|uniref:hypothetical protein n=1 Tax=Apilactobacillus xinyiensis TaxID=2841032 RepID=UPI00200FE9BF|nr:hypothetical protein [Apilactobacillus xinyiensis]MCL0330670.1 hypothetical protein [Apilactobacillus xinyiensis]